MTTALQRSAQETLRRLVDQIERLDEERRAIVEDIKDKMAEAKSEGFDVKVLRRVLAMRKKEPAERDEEQALIDVYCQALGMQGSFDFGDGDGAAVPAGMRPQ